MDSPPTASQTIGQPVLRTEDMRFLTGSGQFVDDINLSNIAYGYVLRSPHAHTPILRIDTVAALRSPGVLHVLTGKDVEQEGLGQLECRFLPPKPTYRPTHPILVSDKVRHVGDRVAFIVADSLNEARDAAEKIDIEYEILPAVVRPEVALREDAARVWDEAESNLCFHIERGDCAAVDAAFAAACHVTSVEMHYPRASANPIEPRATIGVFDRFQNRYTLHTTSQAPFELATWSLPRC